MRFRCAYRASCFVVVPIHRRASVRTVLPGVGELPGHQHPELRILTAAAPLPALPRRSLVMGVAAAHGGRALGAGTSHRECDASRGYGMDKRRLSGCCGRHKMDRHEDRGTDGELRMDKAICRAANIQTEVLTGIPPGKGLLTKHFIFQTAHLCGWGKTLTYTGHSLYQRMMMMMMMITITDEGSSLRTLEAARAESLQ